MYRAVELRGQRLTDTSRSYFQLWSSRFPRLVEVTVRGRDVLLMDDDRDATHARVTDGRTDTHANLGADLAVNHTAAAAS